MNEAWNEIVNTLQEYQHMSNGHSSLYILYVLCIYSLFNRVNTLISTTGILKAN